MDIDRPEFARQRRQKTIRYGIGIAVVLTLAAAGISRQEPSLMLFTFLPFGEIEHAKRISPRFNLIVVAILSTLAFILAAIGIYGVVSFSVVSRSREMAIRMAIGADPRRLVREIVSDGGKLLVAGLLAGVVASIALARFVSAFLFGLSPFDPMTWLGVSLAFSAIVLVACWLPARRAAAIDPATSLRGE